MYMSSGSHAAAKDVRLERLPIEYDDATPEGYSFENSGCSEAELRFVDDALLAALPALEYSRDNENRHLFDKWFGVSTQPESDADVRLTMSDATGKMYERGVGWTPMCCKSGNGACGTSCQYEGVQAWVESYTYSNDADTEYNSTWVRMCPALMANSNLMEVGFILYHELVHMVSHVVDANVGYGKGPLV